MKSKLNVVVLLLTTFLFDWADSDGRIYGGYPVDIKKAPWMVHIATFFDKLPDGTVLYMFCSGTILRRNLILTAAHCNKNDANGELISASKYVINVGSSRNDLSGGTRHSVKTVFIHPKYRGGGKHNFFHDVGLLELKKNIDLGDRAQLVSIAEPDDRPKDGGDVTITGYGRNPDNPVNKLLYQVQMNVITAERCVNEIAGGDVDKVDQHQICVEGDNKNQCPGDSGGPLHDLCTGRQVGIASYGGLNCTNPRPSVLARVTDNLDYINRIIKKTTRKEPQKAHPTAPMPDIRPL